VDELPTGVLTFLFADMEGSTRLLGRIGRERYAQVLGEYKSLLREMVARHAGRVVDDEGDGVFAVFPRARDAVAAAAESQRELADRDWGDGVELHVRIGLHTGEAEVAGERYVGLAVHRAHRICDAAEGGQTLLSSTTRDLAEDGLPDGIALRDAGERRLKDIPRPERLAELVAEGQSPARRIRVEVDVGKPRLPRWLTRKRG
jgi:class 3 adenylate cyclase